MLISFDESTVKDVELLANVSDSGVVDGLLELSLKALKDGVKQSYFGKLGKKLGVDDEIVVRIVEGVAKLTMEAAKANLSKDHFTLAALDIGLPDATMGALIRFYVEHRAIVDEIVKSTAQTRPGSTPYYQNLDWRLDVEVARRTLHSSIEPSLLPKLDTRKPGTEGDDVDGATCSATTRVWSFFIASCSRRSRSAKAYTHSAYFGTFDDAIIYKYILLFNNNYDIKIHGTSVCPKKKLWLLSCARLLAYTVGTKTPLSRHSI